METIPKPNGNGKFFILPQEIHDSLQLEKKIEAIIHGTNYNQNPPEVLQFRKKALIRVQKKTQAFKGLLQMIENIKIKL